MEKERKLEEAIVYHSLSCESHVIECMFDSVCISVSLCVCEICSCHVCVRSRMRSFPGLYVVEDQDWGGGSARRRRKVPFLVTGKGEEISTLTASPFNEWKKLEEKLSAYNGAG